MLTLTDSPGFLEDMEKRAKQLALSIIRSLDGRGSTRVLVRESELLAVSPSSLIHIVKGIFRCQHGEKTIRLFSTGDLLLAPEEGEGGELRITSEFGSEIAVVGQEAFLEALTRDSALLRNWLSYQNLENRIGHLLCSVYMAEEVKHDPELRQYAAGDVLIRENDEPQEVYEMLQGSASVTLGDLTLAVIKEGEIFGELSFFTGQKRTATVIALEPCLVQVIDKNDFLRIMKYRPALVEGMVKTLCRRLVDLNAQIQGIERKE